jgi:TetR/AcrR family transcriptional regulator, transcriptional repressor for nem operon
MIKIIFCFALWCTAVVLSQEVSMPYPSDHRENKRAQIIDSARRLFNRNGFDNVSLKQIMAGAGLTHGGFYNYFKGKSDLYSEVLGCFFTDPNWKSRWDGVEVDLASSDAGPQIIRAYLSRQHFADVDNSCPMVALPSDVSRAGKNAKRAFNNVFQAMVTALQRSMPRSRDSAGVASAIAALCVGGMVVARAIEDTKAADQLRDDCMAVALSIGGWNAVKRGRPKQ